MSGRGWRRRQPDERGRPARSCTERGGRGRPHGSLSAAGYPVGRIGDQTTTDPPPGDLTALAEAVPPRYRALVLVGGVLGLRWSEAIGLRVRDVDFLRRTVTVAQTVAEVEGRVESAAVKTRSSARTLSARPSSSTSSPLTSLLIDPGRDRKTWCSPVRRTDSLVAASAARVFAPAVRTAGLDEALTFHGLCHVAASLMVEAGEHPRVIQQRLGHATSRLSMELYAHVPEAADRDVAIHVEIQFAIRSGTQRARGVSEADRSTAQRSKSAGQG